jgi:protein-S-isoprenylcysteine O-methyltransferase Ste14
MYLGMVFALLGSSLALGTWHGLLVPVAFACLIHRLFIRHEEEMLEAEFGEAYMQYRRQVRRWL